MNASDLNRLLRGDFNGEDLKSKIFEEVSTYSQLMNKKGSSIPLNFNEDEDLTMDNTALQNLLSEALAERLSNYDLAYICDCLSMGERVSYSNERVQEVIFEIADPDINGLVSKLDLNTLIEECKTIL